MNATPDAHFLTTLLPLAGIVFVIAVGVIVLNQHFRKNLYRQMLVQEEMKNQHQQVLLRSAIEVQENERKRIAQDMHDELGAGLAIVRMQLVQLEQQHKNDPLREPLKQIRASTETILVSMRRLTHELMPPQLESFGLIKTLESVCDKLMAANGINIRLQAPDNLHALQKPVALALYRICMEMIHNTIKHAAAKQAELSLSERQGVIKLCYQDDGKGLPEEMHADGLGFRSIEARVISLGGDLHVGNGDNGGFYAMLTLPVNHT